MRDGNMYDLISDYGLTGNEIRSEAAREDEEVFEIISAGQPTHLTFWTLVGKHLRTCTESECLACEIYG